MMIPNYQTDTVRTASPEEEKKLHKDNRKANARAEGRERKEAA